MKPQEEIEKLCKSLKPIIGTQADDLWHMYLAEDIQNRQRFAQDIEILAEKLLKESPLENPQVLLEPPDKKDAQGTYLVGDVIYNKKKENPLYLRKQDFLKQIGIFAITGEGKTNLAYHLALQLLQTDTPFMIIDWKRSWRNLLSLSNTHPKLKNVQIFTIGRDTLPLLWNAFKAPPGTNQEAWIK